jgi:hypothetical protein
MGRKVRWTLSVLVGLAILLTGGYFVLSAVAASRLEEVVAGIRAEGAPLTLAEIAPPPIPDGCNAAVVLKRAFAAFVDLRDEDDEALATFDEDPLGAPAEVVVVMVDWVASNADARHLMDEALKRPNCRFDLDYTSVETLEYRHIVPVLNLSRLTMIDGLLALRGGRPADAFADCRRLLDLARCSESEPTLISLLWRIALEETALRLLHLTLDRVSPDEATCVALRSDLGRIDIHAAAARSARAERAFFFSALERIRLEPAAREEALWADELLGFIPISWIPDSVVKLDEAFALGILARRIALADRPYHEVREEWEALHRDAVNAPWYAVLSEAGLRELLNMRMRVETHRTRIDLADLSLAVRLHEIEHGELPGALIDLDVDLPVDPFAGEAYRYTPGPNGGFTLHGVGPNGRDDGGEDDDIVWPPAREE